jgi:hypothetical protein
MHSDHWRPSGMTSHGRHATDILENSSKLEVTEVVTTQQYVGVLATSIHPQSNVYAAAVTHV